VLKELQNGSRNKYVINAVVNRTVSEMKNVQKFVPSKAFKIIAEKIFNKYPQTSKDINEDSTCFGEGFHIAYLKLRDRNYYLNKPHMKRSLSQSLNIPLKKQKKYYPIKQDVVVDNKKNILIQKRTKLNFYVK